MVVEKKKEANYLFFSYAKFILCKVGNAFITICACTYISYFTLFVLFLLLKFTKSNIDSVGNILHALT